MLMQSYDFYDMHQKYGCNLQCGGDDQWSNILGGTRLIRKKTGDNAYGFTFTLLLTSEGKKMGKTQSGAVWLDPNKTPPYDFYQYWRNVDDADVIKCLKLLTFVPLEEIDALAALEGSGLNRAKEVLAYELTSLIHGEAEAKAAQETARGLFSGGGDLENMPTTELSEEDFKDGSIDAVSLLLKCGLAGTRNDAKRLIEQGGIEAEGVKLNTFTEKFGKEVFSGDGMIVKKGKKIFHRAILK